MDIGNYQTMSDESINSGGAGDSGPTVCATCGREIDPDETYCAACKEESTE
jgi:predicted amidophosphoribosyltransferase